MSAAITSHMLGRLLTERLVGGLRRQAITRTSQWAEMYRVMGQPFPGPWNFRHHPWLREIHDCEAELIVSKKAAQMGLTETALNKALKAIDIDGVSVMYVLPASKPDASDFSSSRFDPALEMSEHLSRLFTDVQNVFHKRAGNANLYLRGSKSRSQLKSVPAAFMVFDEVEEMDQKNIPLAFERMSGQTQRQAFMLSTPKSPGMGISKYFSMTTEEEFTFQCPHCKRWIMFEFPDCLVIKGSDLLDPVIEDSYYICKECKGILVHDEKINYLANGKWIPRYANRTGRGFHINQMYSMAPAGKAAELAKATLRAEISPADEQELWNSKLGLAHIVEGARVEDKHIIKCQERGGYVKVDGAPTNSYVTMGIDVGKWIHFVINQWFLDESMMTFDINLMATSKLLMEAKVLSFEELDKYMHAYSVMYAVIDAEPEVRKSIEFAQRFHGRISTAYYSSGLKSKIINTHKDTCAISVGRTAWLDMSLGRVISGRASFPRDLSMEFKEHLKALVRIYEKDRDGNPIGRYTKDENTPDHFAHAFTYAEIALPMGLGIAQTSDIVENT
jgi:hypothetical protein